MAPRSRSKYIVTEFMRDSLHELIHNPTVVLDESLLLSMVKNVAAGMHYLHSMEPPVLHGTLRTVNVLVDSNLTAKVRRPAQLLLARNAPIARTPEIIWQRSK